MTDILHHNRKKGVILDDLMTTFIDKFASSSSRFQILTKD